MILRAFFCNVNIRLHLKPQAVMQKYICGKIKELYIRLRICCGIDFFILFMMPVMYANIAAHRAVRSWFLRLIVNVVICAPCGCA